jgi:hypothetical protein
MIPSWKRLPDAAAFNCARNATERSCVMATRKKLDPIILEGVRIMFRNFEGKEKQYNAKGERNFNIELDPKTAEAMLADGWRIKYLKPYEDGDEPKPIIKVKVELEKGRPPRIIMITSKGRTNLSQDPALIGMLDVADIKTADMELNPYWSEVNGKAGYSAYLRSLYVTIEESELDLKYADLDEVGASGVAYEMEADVPF